MPEAQVLSFAAMTLYVGAAAVFCVGFLVPMDPWDRWTAARMVSAMLGLATLMFLFALARAAGQ